MLALVCFVAALIAGSDAVTSVTGVVNTTALEGEATSLSCIAGNLQAADTLSWSYASWNGTTSATIATVTGTAGTPIIQTAYQSNVQFNGTLAAGQFNLVINNVTEYFLGRYTCSSGVQQSIADLNVLVKPSLTIEYDGLMNDRDTVKFPLENEVELKCKAERGRENVQVTWLLDNSDISGSATSVKSNQQAFGFETVTSTLKRSFSRSEKGKRLRCVVQLGSRSNATFTDVTVDGVPAMVASKLFLGALALLARFFYN